ncbi:hypothetical protein DYBT9275_04071 [Dyadobacter sp. CECT 9275]|uniref:DUF72 domain-containing protein n=1 Tax=Dyadobacter helix TaxID=2822344 RepID=A0A916JF54_9BACT|nr:DUF72 domain-containing protein [Dyadobacter sp. CECT 9275]CAG5007549.1 hypothetical protein DYBT9275_04071 [Dyadobacter sp. CECT 9275]
MDFGSVPNAKERTFQLPPDAVSNEKILSGKRSGPLHIYVGCAKWGSDDLKNFYPRGVKDELAYYATQFDCVELNASWYSIPAVKDIVSWCSKTPEDFRFFPKIYKGISHTNRLLGVEALSTEFLTRMAHFGPKLATIFLQMHEQFDPSQCRALIRFLQNWPAAVPLAVELRHEEWFDGSWNSDDLFAILENRKIPLIITDTAGRRDLLHMRLTSPAAFIRYTGANADSDFTRLDEWAERIKIWADHGLENLYFFVHQNNEEITTHLAAHFIKKLNTLVNCNLRVPKTQPYNILPNLFGEF